MEHFTWSLNNNDVLLSYFQFMVTLLGFSSYKVVRSGSLLCICLFAYLLLPKNVPDFLTQKTQGQLTKGQCKLHARLEMINIGTIKIKHITKDGKSNMKKGDYN